MTENVRFEERIAAAAGEAPSLLWERVDAVVSTMRPEDALAHKVGPLAARAYRRRGWALPPLLARRERGAILAPRFAAPLLDRIRDAYPGRLLLLKGPEIAARYPDRSRGFADIDILVDDPDAAREALRAAGFVDAEDAGDEDAELHHLPPLVFPGNPLLVEVHREIKTPYGIAPPPNADMFSAAVPAVSHREMLTPAPHHHALLLAAHAWAHTPLGRLGDLVDVAALVGESQPELLARDAERWELGPILAATLQASRWLFHGGRRPASARIWARHLPELREPTVWEGHATRWLAPLWAFPLARGAARSLDNLRRDFRRSAGESWSAKVASLVRAARNARRKKSETGWRLDDEGGW